MKESRATDRARALGATKLVHIVTVPETFGFLVGHIMHAKANGFAVRLVSSPGRMPETLGPLADVDWHRVQMERAISPLRDLLALSRLWRFLRVVTPHVVHAHTPKAGLLGVVAARLAGVPVVVLSVFGLVQMNRRGPVKWLLDAATRVSCGLADAVWCDSFSVRAHVVAEGLSAARKTVVLGHGSVSGVDAEGTFSIPANWQEVRRELRSRYGIPHGATVLGFVGRLAREKGLGELTEAWRRLRSSYQNLHLLLVGGLDARDPPTACDLDFLSSEERSHLVGFQTNTPAHYLAMDVCVTPSYREGFGLTNIEASAMCLPVVSTRIPGCTDSVLDGVTGTLVPVHDVAALTRAIENYLVNPDLAQRHGRAGRERVLKDFRPEALWEALQAEYLGLLGKRGLQPLPSDGG